MTDKASRRTPSKRPKAGWWFWLCWVLANTIGAVAFLPASLYMLIVANISLTFQSWTIAIVLMSLGGAVLGAVIGLAQWLVLRTHLPRSRWWLLATSLGMALGIFLAVVAVKSRGWHFWSLSVGLGQGIAGFIYASYAVAGFAQWLVLRRQVPKFILWALANLAIALICAFLVTGFGDIFFGVYASFSISSMITGAVLVWLLS